MLVFKSKITSGDNLKYFIIMRNPGEVSQCLQRRTLLYHTPDLSTQPDLLLVYYSLISLTSWVIICFSLAEAYTHKKKDKMQNVSSCDLCHLDLVPSVNMTSSYSHFQICLLNWSSVLWVTLLFTVNLSDVVPLREPSHHSEIWNIIVSCSKWLCF